MSGKIGMKKTSKYEGKFNVGDKYGEWKVIDNTIKQINSQAGASVLVKCSCGNKSYISCKRLITGDSKGCPHISRGKNNYFWKGIGDIPGRYLGQIKRSANKRNKEYNISNEYLWELYIKQNKKCALSGLEINFGNNINDMTASLDRIDSNFGYIKGNVMWVHKHINTMKNNFTNDYLIQLCKVIYEYNK